jgi:hypothetical protein
MQRRPPRVIIHQGEKSWEAEPGHVNGKHPDYITIDDGYIPPPTDTEGKHFFFAFAWVALFWILLAVGGAFVAWLFTHGGARA